MTHQKTPQCILEDVEEAAGGHVHSLALKKYGSSRSWGDNTYNMPGIQRLEVYEPRWKRFWPD
jgi:hypothetical protein